MLYECPITITTSSDYFRVDGSQAFGPGIQEITYSIDWKLGFIFLFSAVLASAFGHMMYNYAIKKVGPAEAAIFMNLNTLFAVTGAALFLNEVIRVNHVVGFILILSGISPEICNCCSSNEAKIKWENEGK